MILRNTPGPKFPQQGCGSHESGYSACHSSAEQRSDVIEIPGWATEVTPEIHAREKAAESQNNTHDQRK